MSVTAALGAHGAPVTIEWNGMVLAFKCLEMGTVISGLEMYLIEYGATKFAAVHRPLVAAGLISQEEMQAKISEFTRQCVDESKCSLGSELMNKILGMSDKGEIAKQDGIDPTDPEKKKPIDPVTYNGQMKLVSLMLDITIDEAVALVSQKSEEIGLKLALAMKMSGPSPKTAVPKAEGAESSPVSLTM